MSEPGDTSSASTPAWAAASCARRNLASRQAASGHAVVDIFRSLVAGHVSRTTGMSAPGRLSGVTAPLVLLDSASLYFRAFFGVPASMTSPDGIPVNAVRGFTDTLARIITERRPGRLVACLDADWRPAFRVALLPSYKAHRVADEAANAEEVPDTLSPQVPIILDVLAAVGIATAEAAGHEADDVIGTLTARERVAPVEAITGDRDLFQIVRDKPTPARVIYVGKGWQRAEVIGPVE